MKLLELFGYRITGFFMEKVKTEVANEFDRFTQVSS